MGYSQGQMIALGVIFLVLPSIVVSLRIWAKTMSRKGLAWDDYLILLALAISIGTCAVQIDATINGQLGQTQATSPDGMPLLQDPRFLRYERCKFALQLLSYPGLGLAKASILLLYLRIFDVRYFRLQAIGMLVIVGAWTVSFFFAGLFECYPITPLIEAFYGNKCVDTIALWYAGGATDIFTDFLILAMPVPLVLKLQLPWKQKLGVLSMFLLGALACASSIVRLVVFVQVGSVLATHFNNETYYTSPVFFWTVIELSLAVISASLPTLRPLFLRFVGSPRIRSLKSSYKSPSRQYGSSRYGNSNPSSEDPEDHPLQPVDGTVQTHIIGAGNESPVNSSRGGIMVKQRMSSDL